MTDRGKRGLTVTDAEFEGNTSGWQAVDYKVIVRRDKVEEMTKGGILVPAETRGLEEWNVTTGVLVAHGDNAFTFGRKDNGELYQWLIKPKPGDRVMIREYQGLKFVGDDGESYLMLVDKDISAVKLEAA